MVVFQVRFSFSIFYGVYFLRSCHVVIRGVFGGRQMEAMRRDLGALRLLAARNRTESPASHHEIRPDLWLTNDQFLCLQIEACGSVFDMVFGEQGGA